ncbi:hypothetical protein Ciccas_001818 [Cichlidogyrus casuarinus]|uniref:Uncharacterized protein n=1 Tax=Cichlidogyrus casuarinus TaxID=1844966 RepID=A0ABD2QM57_9PLAT
MVGSELPIVTSHSEIKHLVLSGRISTCTEGALARIVSKQLNVTIENFVPTAIHEKCFARANGIFSLMLKSVYMRENSISTKNLFYLFSDVKHLHLDGIQVWELPKEFMANMRETESLTFTRNNLMKIHNSAFRSQFSTLTSLSFYKQPSLNDLLVNSAKWTAQLPDTLTELGFGHMASDSRLVAPLQIDAKVPIKSLTISFCDINDLETDRYPSVSSKTLKLRMEESSLTQVNLDGNKFGSSENFLSVLSTFSRLDAVSLRDNKNRLSSMNLGKKLQLMDLTGSWLESKAAGFFSPVKTLILTEAKIYGLEAGALKGKEVQKLVLREIPQFMRVKVAEKPANWSALLKDTAPTLRELDLAGNSLTLDGDLELQTLVNLETLDLQNNAIAQFPGHLIGSLGKLKELNLAENKIAQLAMEDPGLISGPVLDKTRNMSINLSGNPIKTLLRCDTVNGLLMTLEDFLNNFSVNLENSLLACHCDNAWISDRGGYQDIQCYRKDRSGEDLAMVGKSAKCNPTDWGYPCILAEMSTTFENTHERGKKNQVEQLDVNIVSFDKKTDTIWFELGELQESNYFYPKPHLQKETQTVLKKIEGTVNKVLAFWRVGQLETLKLNKKIASQKQGNQFEFRLEKLPKGKPDDLYLMVLFVNRTYYQMKEFYRSDFLSAKEKQVPEENRMKSKNRYTFWIMLGSIMFALLALFVGGVILASWLSRKMKRHKDLIMNGQSSSNCSCKRVDCQICSEKQRQSLLGRTTYSTITNDLIDDDPLPNKASAGFQRNTWANKTIGFFRSISHGKKASTPTETYPFNNDFAPKHNSVTRTGPLPSLPLPKINPNKDADSHSSTDDLYYAIN